jgi:hypothetical protein
MSKLRIITILFLLGVLVLTKLTFSKTQTGKMEIKEEYKYLLEDIDKRIAINLWLNNLEPYENCPTNGIIDTNGKISAGPLCYQDLTFVGFVKRYDLLPKAEDHEILNMRGDRELQFKASREALMESLENVDHWRTSVKRGAGKIVVK